MVFQVYSMGLGGIQGYGVSVECCITQGLPGFDIVGLPDAAVKESRERVRAGQSSTVGCSFQLDVLPSIWLRLGQGKAARFMIYRSSWVF